MKLKPMNWWALSCGVLVALTAGFIQWSRVALDPPPSISADELGLLIWFLGPWVLILVSALACALFVELIRRWRSQP